MSGETILIVDDNSELAEFLAGSLLPSFGYQTRVAYTGASALALLKVAQPALMLLDLELPDTSGIELLEKLAKQGQQIPTILFTAHGSEKVAIDAFHLGVQDYLIKPAEADELERAITRALTVTRLRAETARLNQELTEQISWLSTLSKIGQSLTSSLNLSEVLRRIVEAGVSLTQAEEGFLALLDQATGQLYLRAVKNIDGKNVQTMHLPVIDSLVGEALRTGKPIRITTEGNRQNIKVSTGFLVQSLVHVPLLSKNRALGVLTVDHRLNRRVFTAKDEALLTSLADYAAAAIENANLYQQAQHEITERKRVEQALRESEERYARAIQGANDGIWDWDLRSNAVIFSPRWKAMLGYSQDEIGEDPGEWLNRVHPEDIQKVKLDLSAHIRGLTSHFENEHRMLHKDGAYAWVLSRGLAFRETTGTITRLAGSQSNISARKAAEAKLQHDAFYDQLTGLPNRALFMDRLNGAIERARRRSDLIFAVLYLDLDQFKNINDRFGHPAGDQLLINIGALLKSSLRAADTVARLGGDEFVILLDEVKDIESARAVSEHILKQFSAPIKLRTGREEDAFGDKDVYVTTSIGVVLSSFGYQQAEDALRDADIALYEAKAHGKATYEIFDPAMREHILRRLSLESDLRRAIGDGQLEISYQPIISLATRKLVSFEALTRWHHPERGLVLPGEFIPLAQESGLISLIDQWVLEQACQQMQTWRKRFTLSLSLSLNVNITSQQIEETNLVEIVRQILTKTGFPAAALQLEITENTVMENDDKVNSTVTKLTQMGVHLQIDDFGTGYSSLSYLQRIPFQALKIDRSFITRLSEEGTPSELVRTIIGLAHDLGMEAVAEGIENEKQYNLLIQMGCDYGQGTWIADVLNHQAAEELLEKIQKDKSGASFIKHP